MKTALIVRNNFTQLVCTPENEFEQSIVEGLKKGDKQARITTGYLDETPENACAFRTWRSKDLIIIFDERVPPAPKN